MTIGISIITPHHNDFKGLKRIHSLFLNQDSKNWEWIIVDDFSKPEIRASIKSFFNQNPKPNIKIIFNDSKTNASVCRNIGIEYSISNRLVFLDADDSISEDFVRNRCIEVNEFVVFKNFIIVDVNGQVKSAPIVSSNYLDCFLRAKFIWQTSCIVWNKEFLIKIGKFNTELKRLQDVELSIRALILGSNYQIMDNKVDFYYHVAPIDVSKRPVKIICDAVNYLVNLMQNNYQFDKYQRKLVTGYYYLCVRYFSRSKNKSDLEFVENSLKSFHQNKFMSFLGYMRALTILRLYKLNLISGDLFLRLNRYFYK
ncbi:glycosyltransferase family A protein [Aegicerativicinus sediminis]|uniref:glycosyltransferase family A protein n=1 Tax=Aegicerativicinus sediminis TaxID=2893202 RepID=UPI001E5F91DF|nr:glycosyltransferase family A protein [Aegicerativicinus sediminis]